MNPVFVFERETENIREIRVVDDVQHITLDPSWKLIATLDPTILIQILLREFPSLVSVLKGDSV